MSEPFQIVTYEAFVDDPAYVFALLARLGPMRENRVVVDNEPRPIRNENRKHYGS